MTLPRVVIDGAALKRVLNFDGWVYRDEVAQADPSLPPGEPVEVVGRSGRFAAYAFYNPRSHIALRIVSLRQDEPIGEGLFRRRITEAVSRRGRLRDTNARRLIFSEADALPGLIVDQYDRWLVLQLRTAGMDRYREALVGQLREALNPAGILERSDKEFRADEGLEPLRQILHGEVPNRITIEESGLRFVLDPHGGHKTGFYLDQREARRRLRQSLGPGDRMADVFSYTGSFGVAAAASGAHVVCVEQDEPSLGLAKENARINGVLDRMEFVAANAFYWLEAKAQAQTRFDVVMLDPPSLAKTRAEAQSGRQALHHLTVNALGLLGPGGRLAVSICTYHLLGVAEEIIRIAGAQRGQRLWVREQWLQAEDHPWILQIPATRYLTTWWLELDGPPTGSPTSLPPPGSA